MEKLELKLISIGELLSRIGAAAVPLALNELRTQTVIGTDKFGVPQYREDELTEAGLKMLEAAWRELPAFTGADPADWSRYCEAWDKWKLDNPAIAPAWRPASTSELRRKNAINNHYYQLQGMANAGEFRCLKPDGTDATQFGPEVLLKFEDARKYLENVGFMLPTADNFVTRYLSNKPTDSESPAVAPVRRAPGLFTLAEITEQLVIEELGPQPNEPQRVAHITKTGASIPACDGPNDELLPQELIELESLWAAAGLQPPRRTTKQEWDDVYLPAFEASPARPSWRIQAVFSNPKGQYTKQMVTMGRAIMDALRRGPTLTNFGLQVDHPDEGGFLTMEAARARLAEPRPKPTNAASLTEEQGGSVPEKKARQRQGEQVLQALVARNLDPLNLEPAPLGNKPWPLRDELGDKLRLSTVQMKKTFTWLRKECLVKHRPRTKNPAPK